MTLITPAMQEHPNTDVEVLKVDAEVGSTVDCQARTPAAEDDENSIPEEGEAEEDPRQEQTDPEGPIAR